MHAIISRELGLREENIHDLGNTPGHIQHWSMRNFKKFIEDELKIVSGLSCYAVMEKKE
jgi:hypothetical protein